MAKSLFAATFPRLNAHARRVMAHTAAGTETTLLAESYAPAA